MPKEVTQLVTVPELAERLSAVPKEQLEELRQKAWKRWVREYEEGTAKHRAGFRRHQSKKALEESEEYWKDARKSLNVFFSVCLLFTGRRGLMNSSIWRFLQAIGGWKDSLDLDLPQFRVMYGQRVLYLMKRHKGRVVGERSLKRPIGPNLDETLELILNEDFDREFSPLELHDLRRYMRSLKQVLVMANAAELLEIEGQDFIFIGKTLNLLEEITDELSDLRETFIKAEIHHDLLGFDLPKEKIKIPDSVKQIIRRCFFAEQEIE